MTITLTQVIVTLLTILGGGGAIGAIIGSGVAQKWIKPIVKEALASHEENGKTIEERKRVIAAVIEDHARRNDGHIYVSITAQENRFSTTLDGALASLRSDIATLIMTVNENGERLAHIEGMLNSAAAEYASHPMPKSGGLRSQTPPHGNPMPFRKAST